MRSKLAAANSAGARGACAKSWARMGLNCVQGEWGAIEITTVKFLSSSRDKNKYFIALVKNKIQMI